MYRDLDAVFATHAAVQLGLVRDLQLIAAGATRQQIRRRVRAGRWERVLPGVLGAPGRVVTPLSDQYAAILSMPDGAIVSGRVGASIQRFRSAGDHDAIEVHILGRDDQRRRSFTIHTTTWLPDRHRTTIDDLVPITIRERTWLELLPWWDPARMSRALDEELARRRIDLDLLLELAVRFKGRGHPGAAKLDAALGRRLPGEEPPHSDTEALLFRRLEELGFPRPLRQAVLPAILEKGIVDCMYEDPPLIIEADGRSWHAQVAQMERDRRRDGEASARGYGIARPTYRMLQAEPEWLDRVASLHFHRHGWRSEDGQWRKRATG